MHPAPVRQKPRRVAAVALVAAIAALIAPAPRAQADESLGKLELSDLFLEPQYIYVERATGGGGFSPGSSFVAARWTRDRVISATFKVGSKSLIGVPARYQLNAPAAGDLGLVEAYAQADSDYGRVRFGLVPIPFGLEGGDREEQLRFPRSLTYTARLVNLRDYGMVYRIALEGFFSEWAIHNGEGGPDLDNEAWLTARWGWEDGHLFRVGLSGSTGRTSPKATDPSGTVGGASNVNDALLNVDAASRIRVANGFLDWILRPFRIGLEATAGDTFQGDNVIKFRASHADLEYQPSSSFSLLARYDTISARNDVPNNQITELTGGVAWRSRYENSVLYLLATKHIQQDVPQDVHRAMVVWRITPIVNTEQGAL